MRTLRLTLAYDGTHFLGWQVQPQGRTVQQVLEAALEEIAGRPVKTAASGRTDAGVHALGQVVSFRTESSHPPEVFLRALNGKLPEDVRVLAAAEAPEGFHALRDATGKRYRYLLHDGPVADVFRRHYCWHVREPLDAAAMARAAAGLVGRHDFASFQSSGSERKSTVRTIRELTVSRGGGDEAELITVEIEADGFLYNMARAIVGALVEVGRGAQDADWPAEVLAARDRRQGAMTAPPQGLFLVRVEYQ